jgi:hypothetical protein
MAAPRGATTNGQAPLVGKRRICAVGAGASAGRVPSAGERDRHARRGDRRPASGASALQAENADLRATQQRVRDRRSARTPAAEHTELIEVSLRLDGRVRVDTR